jgi:hypothetical protein
MKVFDILKKHKLTDDVQKNIKIILNEYTSKFYVKYKKIKIPVTMDKDPNKIFYSLIYDVENRTYDMFPIKINFIDITIHGGELNNNSYIANIHKTDKLSGSDMIQIALFINRAFNVKKSYIYDGTLVECNGAKYDLSYLKLLEKSETFYTKFGFKFGLDVFDCMKFSSSDEKHKYVMSMIKKCKKVKINDIKTHYLNMLNLIQKIVKEQEYSKVKIYYFRATERKNMWTTNKPELSIFELFYEINEMLQIFNQTKEKYLYKLMVGLFNDKSKCQNYNIISKYLIDNQFYKITYKDTTIKYDLLECFKILQGLRYSIYEYTY